MGKKKLNEVEVDSVVSDLGTDFLSLYLPISGWAVEAIAKGKMTRVMATVNELTFPCALRPQKDGNYHITLSKEKVKKMKVVEGMRVMVKIAPDLSEYGFPVPEEFEELMLQDPEVKVLFDKLNPGQRRGWLYYISSGKSVDTRIKRALEIAEKVREKFY